MKSEMENEIVIFRTDDETINVEVRFEDETAWLTQDQMSVLFSKSKSTINEHIKNVFKEGELDEKEVVRKFRITTPHGAIEGKTQSHEVNFYNLDVIISVGYRVKSLRGTQFRQWATKRLKEYIVKGFTMDDDRLKKLGGGNYWQELMARIRDIRASEKVFYRQVLDIYATKMFEPMDGAVTLKKGNGRRVSYMSVKRYADTLKEIALKRRISIAAVLSEACQQPIVAKRPAARMNPKRAKA